jgi:chromate transporter
MLLPGPEATQLATYIGWLLHRTLGGVVAGVLFVLPGFVSILALSVLYVSYGQLPAVSALFFGLKAAVLAVVIEAVVRIGKRALASRFLIGVAAAAFVAIFALHAPFPAIVLGAGVLGFVASKLSATAIPAPATRGSACDETADTVLDAMASRGELAHAQPTLARALRVLAVCVPLWALPFAACAVLRDAPAVLWDESLFFSKMAVVTFGGAYAVLAYVAQQAVQMFGWLRPGEMLDGLGLAETTPGPLIMVTQFVGFLGAYRHPGALSPLMAAVLGSLVTVWVTFVPCFLWIFLGAPYIEALRGSRVLQAALSAITAAVVGVILNLSVWFALHVVFRQVGELALGPVRLPWPQLTSVDAASAVLSVAALLALFRFRLGLPKTLAASALCGVVYKLLT